MSNHSLALFLLSEVWMLAQTFAECMDEAHQVRSLARAQDLTQGPDVVFGQSQGLDLGQFLGFWVAGHHFPKALQSII